MKFGLLVSPNEIFESETDREKVIKDEIRWHYSQHYFAEMNGEEVIESMLKYSCTKKQRALLGAQLIDEKTHSVLFQKEISRIGLEPRATGYAEGYKQLVANQKTFVEKVFVFQILTEAISAAYCQWRIDNIKDDSLNAVDFTVAADEKRHLNMGKVLLQLCEQDEIEANLTANKRKSLLRQMNNLCVRAIRIDMFNALATQPALASNVSNVPTSLDHYISKAVLREIHKMNTEFLNLRIKNGDLNE